MNPMLFDQWRGYEDIARSEAHAIGHADGVAELFPDLRAWHLVRRLGMEHAIGRSLFRRVPRKLHRNRLPLFEFSGEIGQGDDAISRSVDDEVEDILFYIHVVDDADPFGKDVPSALGGTNFNRIDLESLCCVVLALDSQAITNS